MTEHARRHKRTANADQRNLKLHVLPHWRNRPYEAIGRKDVIGLCEGVVAKGVAGTGQSRPGFALEDVQLRGRRRPRVRQPLRSAQEAFEGDAATRVLSDDEVRLF
jgi:hypothetical protein